MRVSRPNGEIVDIDPADAQMEVAQGGRILTPREVGKIEGEKAKREVLGSAQGQILGFQSGAFRTLSMGASDHALVHDDPQMGDLLAGLGEENPWATGIGEAAPMVAAGIAAAPAGIAGLAAEGAASGAFAEAGQLIGERAMFPNRELTAEKALARMGFATLGGAVFGAGTGLPGAALKAGGRAFGKAATAGAELAGEGLEAGTELAKATAKKVSDKLSMKSWLHAKYGDDFVPNKFDKATAEYAGIEDKLVARLHDPEFAGRAANPQRFQHEVVKGEWAEDVVRRLDDIDDMSDGALEQYQKEIYSRAGSGALQTDVGSAVSHARRLKLAMDGIEQGAIARGVPFRGGKLGEVLEEFEKRTADRVVDGVTIRAPELSAEEAELFSRNIFGSIWDSKRGIDEKLAAGFRTDTGRQWGVAAREALKDIDSVLQHPSWGKYGNEMYAQHSITQARRVAQGNMRANLGKQVGDVLRADKEKIGNLLSKLAAPSKSRELADLKTYLKARKAEMDGLKKLGHLSADDGKPQAWWEASSKVDELLKRIDKYSGESAAVNQLVDAYKHGLPADRFGMYTIAASASSLVKLPSIVGIVGVEAMTNPARAYATLHLLRKVAAEHGDAAKAGVKKLMAKGRELAEPVARGVASAGRDALDAGKLAGRAAVRTYDAGAGATAAAGGAVSRKVTDKYSVEDRIEGLQKMATNPNVLAGALGNITDDAPELASAITLKAQGVLRELLAAAPPITRNTLLGPQRKKLTHAESHQFQRLLDAMDGGVLHLLEQATAGTLSPSMVAAVERVYPETVQEVRDLIMEALADINQEPPYHTRVQIGLLFGLPADVTLSFEYQGGLLEAQSAWLPQEDGPGGAPAKPSREYARGIKDSADNLQTEEDRLAGGIDR